MKTSLIKLPGLTLAIALSSHAVADGDASPCQAKEDDVREQIQHAQDQGNDDRLEGLERALKGIQEGCTLEGLLADAEQEVKDSLAEVQERQDDLEEALENDDVEDIQKRREKLEEATLELEEHSRQLQSLQQPH
ncbi:DUF1090 domain-containing protein [Halomonas sp. V046]|uniref:DUF1090 domain-containing protein n=1 Tax=Halomonas sp. V046 TaxID=3459611 RepID=UPI0040442DF0